MVQRLCTCRVFISGLWKREPKNRDLKLPIRQETMTHGIAFRFKVSAPRLTMRPQQPLHSSRRMQLSQVCPSPPLMVSRPRMLDMRMRLSCLRLPSSSAQVATGDKPKTRHRTASYADAGDMILHLLACSAVVLLVAAVQLLLACLVMQFRLLLGYPVQCCFCLFLLHC